MALVVSYVSNVYAGSLSAASTKDFGNFNMPTAGILLAVINTTGNNNRTVTGVSIGGSAGNVANAGGAAGAMFSRVTGSGNQNVTVTWSGTLGTFGEACCSVWCITGYNSETPVDTDYQVVTSGTTTTNTIDVPAGGTAVFGAGHNATGGTWSAATNRFTQTAGLVDYFGADYSVAGLAHVETFTSTSGNRRLFSASWAPLADTITLVAGQGSFALNGQGVNFRSIMPAGLGSFALNGQAVGGGTTVRMPAGTGLFLLNGQAIGSVLTVGTLEPGMFSLTGQDVTGAAGSFFFRKTLKAETGYFTYRGGWHSPIPDFSSSETNMKVNRKWWAKLLNG